jgi:hypothetical protein
MTEDWTHILKCDQPTRLAWRHDMVKAVAAKCDSLITHPELRSVLLTAIQEWLHRTENEPPDERGTV